MDPEWKVLNEAFECLNPKRIDIGLSRMENRLVHSTLTCHGGCTLRGTLRGTQPPR